MGTPEKLGKYRLLRHLATGGMAEIWLAEGPKNAIAVIKVILPERARDKTFVQMFLDEARVAGTLLHPNIATLYEVGRDGDTYFHAIEYVHGQNARAVIERSLFQRSPVPLAVTVGVGVAVAAALHYAHERKGTTGEPLDIVHRDVTPSNIMVGWDGVVKLVDFGVALAARRAAETRTGVVKGKLAYMSPEQCRGKRVDRRADVFALGVTLYEMSTQRRAFRAGSEYQTMEKIVRGDLPRPSTLVKEYPPALEAIVLKALATNLNERYPTAAALGSALEQFRREHGLEEPKPATAEFMKRMFGEPRSPQEDAAAAAAADARRAAAELAGKEPGTSESAQSVQDDDILKTGETAERAEPAAAADADAEPSELSDPFGAPPASPAALLAAMAGAGVPRPAGMRAPTPAPVVTGPMPVVPAPGPTAAMAVAAAAKTVDEVLPPAAPAKNRGMMIAAVGAAAVAAAVLVFVLVSGSRGAATSLKPVTAAAFVDAAQQVSLPEEPVPEPQPAAVQPAAPAAAPAAAAPAPADRIVPARAEEVTLTITSRPVGAEVTIDGTVRGRTPLELRVPRSSVRAKVEVRQAGHVTSRQYLVAERDHTLDVTLERRTARAAAEPPAKVSEPTVEPPPPSDMSKDRY